MITTEKAVLQRIYDPFLEEKSVKLFLKREDLIHPIVSGNKWRKLKYNLEEASNLEQDTLLTFGGAYSNHIHATAAAGAKFGFKTIGVIRGEEVLPLNTTLSFAKEEGMQLHYVTRAAYRSKNRPDFLENLQSMFGDFYLIPEGGANQLAVKGCQEITDEIDIEYDFICASCGTGTTLAGIVRSADAQTKVLGFSALKGNFLKEEVKNRIGELGSKTSWSINIDYHFGGYAKIKPELVEFINAFKKAHNIQLEPIYTGKMLFGIYNLIREDYFPQNITIVALHTGGLQGLDGMRERYNLL